MHVINLIIEKKVMYQLSDHSTLKPDRLIFFSYLRRDFKIFTSVSQQYIINKIKNMVYMYIVSSMYNRIIQI